MSTSDSDAATENTPLMDTHVEETRSDVDRSYRKKKRLNPQNDPNSQAKRQSVSMFDKHFNLLSPCQALLVEPNLKGGLSDHLFHT